MKPLDVVKVLMGIMSERDSVKQFHNDGEFWARLHEYDYEQLLKLTEEVTHDHYISELGGDEAQMTKRRKISD